MNHHQALSEPLNKSLGNGLTLRYALPEDIDRLVEFNAHVLTDGEGGKPNEHMIEFHL
ncbi:MAG: hypothetical protein Q8N39_08835 [Pelolinea sp.]|nr:hypothetical protein [Pelolinea sp.]